VSRLPRRHPPATDAAQPHLEAEIGTPRLTDSSLARRATSHRDRTSRRSGRRRAAAASSIARHRDNHGGHATPSSRADGGRLGDGVRDIVPLEIEKTRKPRAANGSRAPWPSRAKSTWRVSPGQSGSAPRARALAAARQIERDKSSARAHARACVSGRAGRPGPGCRWRRATPRQILPRIGPSDAHAITACDLRDAPRRQQRQAAAPARSIHRSVAQAAHQHPRHRVHERHRLGALAWARAPSTADRAAPVRSLTLRGARRRAGRRAPTR